MFPHAVTDAGVLNEKSRVVNETEGSREGSPLQ